MPISLVLVDDHPLILDGLRSLFRQEADFDVVAECSNGAQALEVARRRQPDVLVLDLRRDGARKRSHGAAGSEQTGPPATAKGR